jgi:hypothetical protein
METICSFENVGLSPNYKDLQPRRPHSSESHVIHENEVEKLLMSLMFQTGTLISTVSKSEGQIIMPLQAFHINSVSKQRCPTIIIKLNSFHLLKCLTTSKPNHRQALKKGKYINTKDVNKHRQR